MICYRSHLNELSFSWFPELGVFFGVPLLIEVMFPERVLIEVSKVIVFAVKTFEQMGALFALLGLESREIDFVISFVTSCKILAVLS